MARDPEFRKGPVIGGRNAAVLRCSRARRRNPQRDVLEGLRLFYKAAMVAQQTIALHTLLQRPNPL